MRGLKSALAAEIDCAIVHNSFTKANEFPGARYQMETLAELETIVCQGA